MPDDHITPASSAPLALPAEYSDPKNIALAIWFNDALFKRVTQIADYLSKADGITPKHLLGKPQACFFVVEKALTWRLSPSAVAASTYETPGGKIGYEGKLAKAILEASGKFEGDITFEHVGDWSKVQGKFEIKDNGRGKYAVPAYTEADEKGLSVIVRGQVRGEAEPRSFEFELRQAFPRNSTLWALDPKTQICYTAVRRFGNVVCPSIMMGVPFDREDDFGTQMRDITPDRPTRAETFGSAASGEPVITDVEDSAEEEQIDPFVFVNGDGEEENISSGSAWGNRFYAALKEAPNRQIAMGLWDSNSSQLQRFREEVENGPKLADTIEEAYGEAIKRRDTPPAAEPNPDPGKQEPGAAAAADPAPEKAKDTRPNAPRHLGKVPRTSSNGFDWPKAAKALGDAIETSESVEDLRRWQEIHMEWINSIQQNAGPAYTELQRRIAATTEILSGGQE